MEKDVCSTWKVCKRVFVEAGGKIAEYINKKCIKSENNSTSIDVHPCNSLWMQMSETKCLLQNTNCIRVPTVYTVYELNYYIGFKTDQIYKMPTKQTKFESWKEKVNEMEHRKLVCVCKKNPNQTWINVF